MSKPIIGVLPLVDTDRESYWMLPGYMLGVEEAGGIPVMFPLTAEETDLRQLAEAVDGLLFTGGHDVSPSLYGADRSACCGECSRERDDMEQRLLEIALQLDKPVLGICRGIQIINAALGGTLYQDLPTEHPSDIEHHQRPPYDMPVHRVNLVRTAPLYDLLGQESISVNSYHHQAIKTLAPRLQPMVCSEDGLVEAVWLPAARFVWAVQWHPEFSYRTDANSMKILQEFIKASQSHGK